MIVDFHTHTFPEKSAARILQSLTQNTGTAPFTDGTCQGLATSMKKAGVDWSINLPALTRADQVEKINRNLVRDRHKMRERGILTFGGMHPEYANFQKELSFLQENGIPGIKLHPAFQGIDLDDIRMLRVIGAASERGMTVLVHGGMDIGFPDHNYASVSMIERVIREVAPARLVVAHMGGWNGWQEVLQHLAGSPVYFDTSFSLDPEPERTGIHHESLSEEAFLRLVRAHGVGRILFGTDSPWEDQAAYVRQIRKMDLSVAERDAIFYQNAVNLLGETVFFPEG